MLRKEKPQAIYRSLLCSLLSLEALDGSVLAVFATLDKGKWLLMLNQLKVTNLCFGFKPRRFRGASAIACFEHFDSCFFLWVLLYATHFAKPSQLKSENISPKYPKLINLVYFPLVRNYDTKTGSCCFIKSYPRSRKDRLVLFYLVLLAILSGKGRWSLEFLINRC